MKYCINCKFSHKPDGVLICLVKRTSPVTGLGDFRECIENRESASPAACGPQARFYKPKDGIIDLEN